MGRAATQAVQGLQRRYQRIAPFYDLLDAPFECSRYRRIRPLLFRGLSGRILDVGVGTGRNIPFYPTGAEVVGVDLSAAMLQRAARRRVASPATVLLSLMDASRLAFVDASLDAAVASFVFCTLPEVLQIAALRELARVVKPGGHIRLLEYTRPTSSARRLLTRLWAPWVRWAFGASLDQRLDARVETAGLVVISQRNVIGDQVRLLEVEARRGSVA